MKNIHVLPTNKPSRVFITKEEGLGFDNQMLENTELDCQNQNIYITSDEEIKEYDYFLNTLNNAVLTNLSIIDSKHLKKIILTTDQDLIKNGVQTIDDEFLEWFVKNPNREEVEVIKYEDDNSPMLVKDKTFHYKIIIPKEEPKKNFYCGDEVDYDDKCLEQCDRCVDATGVDYGYLPEEHVELINKNIDEFDKKIKEQKQHLIDMMKQDEELEMYEEIQPEQNLKQETIEEAAERLTYTDMLSWENALSKASFINGAKWQQERIHNDEDIESIIAETWIQCVKNDGNNFKAARDRIIKQFKKE